MYLLGICAISLCLKFCSYPLWQQLTQRNLAYLKLQSVHTNNALLGRE